MRNNSERNAHERYLRAKEEAAEAREALRVAQERFATATLDSDTAYWQWQSLKDR